MLSAALGPRLKYSRGGIHAPSAAARAARRACRCAAMGRRTRAHARAREAARPPALFACSVQQHVRRTRQGLDQRCNGQRCTHTHTHTHTHTCIYTCIHTYIHICIHIRDCVRAHVRACGRGCACVRARVRACAAACACARAPDHCAHSRTWPSPSTVKSHSAYRSSCGRQPAACATMHLRVG